ncbi:MAG: (2Fe-2S)-binding protein, partial [Spirochaetales bacterium]|nr:(2Fe-2S)-binding protein [Spirochaetales bacterium]
EGEPIAAALMAQGILIHRKTHKTGESRGVFCGIGQCNDCVMIVDGIPNVRTCVTPVRDGMCIQTQNGYGNWS